MEKLWKEYIEGTSQLFITRELLEDSYNATLYPELDDFSKEDPTDQSGLNVCDDDTTSMLQVVGYYVMRSTKKNEKTSDQTCSGPAES